MKEIPPTIVVRHRRENLKKCSLRGLEGRHDFCFFKYPLMKSLPMEGYILLAADAAVELSQADASRGLLILDGTWRYAEVMERVIPFPDSIVKRRLPRSLTTAYPRKQTQSQGLASIEAIVAAYAILGRETEGLLDHYIWKKAFLEKNPSMK